MEESTNAEQHLRYEFVDRKLLKNALIAAGSSEQEEDSTLQDGANKRLAMVGDALIRLVIVDDWYGSRETRGTHEPKEY